MQIILAKHSGFCEGVERAYRIALKSVNKSKPIYMLGDLVHNKDVVAEFKRRGIKKVKSLKKLVPGSTLIITAHGTTPKIIKEAKDKKLNVVDTTCPWVKKAQKIARELAESGRKVIIVGDKGHPEVIGLKAWAGQGSLVVESEDNLITLKLGKKIAVIAQTTQSVENFKSVVKKLKSEHKNVVYHNTICGATSKRQCSAKDLAVNVDVMIVIGGFNSANTKRLVDLCRAKGVKTYHIQNERELKLRWIKNKKKIGVTAGASTPSRIISEVIGKIKKHEKN